jgi:hypothetical protein
MIHQSTMALTQRVRGTGLASLVRSALLTDASHQGSVPGLLPGLRGPSGMSFAAERKEWASGRPMATCPCAACRSDRSAPRWWANKFQHASEAVRTRDLLSAAGETDGCCTRLAGHGSVPYLLPRESISRPESCHSSPVSSFSLSLLFFLFLQLWLDPKPATGGQG